MVYFKFIAQLMNLIILKRSPIICDNGLWDTVPVNDLVQKELGDHGTWYSGERHSLYPFGKILGGCDYEVMAICR